MHLRVAYTWTWFLNSPLRSRMLPNWPGMVNRIYLHSHLITHFPIQPLLKQTKVKRVRKWHIDPSGSGDRIPFFSINFYGSRLMWLKKTLLYNIFISMVSFVTVRYKNNSIMKKFIEMGLAMILWQFKILCWDVLQNKDSSNHLTAF